MTKGPHINLPFSEIPSAWYNIMPDLPEPPPPAINGRTGKPATKDDLSAIFPDSLIAQEMSADKWIDIPGEVLDAYSLWRPTPLVRAYKLEKRLGTPARMYYKNEGVSPPGSHKPNTAVAQAYYNKEAGIRTLTTETGAGQWGSALSFACKIFGVECKVFMVKVSYEQKPYRRIMMNIWDGNVVPSPSRETEAGRQVLAADPNCIGSLGIAISEAVEQAAQDPSKNYALGSVLNHVMIHQSIIGLETRKQLDSVGDSPDTLIGCVGGGSNFAGLVFPFIPDKLAGKSIDIIAVEPTACPTMTRGPYRYDYGDTAGMTPLLKMNTLGHSFVPSGIHAGGLRYHGMAPLVSLIAKLGLLEARAYPQTPVFEGAILFAETEGVIPAPETSHAIRAFIDEGLKCKETGEAKCIVMNFSGHGHFDLAAYEAYMGGELSDYEHPQEAIKTALKELPDID